MTMSNLLIYCQVSNWADLTSGSPWTFHTNTETGSCCCCWLATPYWGLVGARGPAGEEAGLTGGVAVGVQEGAAAAALVGPALGPAGAAGPVSIAVAGSLLATKAYEGPGGLSFGLAGRGGAWQLAGTGATTLLARGALAGMLPPERPGVCLADELHMIFECPALQAIRQRYAPLFSTDTNTMRSFFAQQDHMQVFKFVLDCLDAFLTFVFFYI